MNHGVLKELQVFVITETSFQPLQIKNKNLILGEHLKSQPSYSKMGGKESPKGCRLVILE